MGAELLNSDLVKKMKINRQTSNLLERDISIEELDAAAAECKTKSAGGPDGISNGFIKKFWTFLRIPLRNYITFCNKRGQMSPSFLTATIKLIPKKGDCTAIKNWRPISLLNCNYKIVSKSINNRF